MFVDEEISLGDFVLTGGEIPTMALIDSVTRLLPGAVGNEGSTHEESFSAALRRKGEYPHYTRPEEFEGNSVPEVLLSGHHAQIQKWRENHLAGLSEMEKEICGIRREYFSSEKPWKARKILFREPIDSDKEFWMKWLNDEEVVAGLCMDTPYTRNDADERFEYQNEDLNGIYLTILDNVSQKPIGSISITVDPDHEHRGNLGMYLGEKKIWGQGYASAAIQEILKTGFELLKLEKITLEVFQENIRAVAMYERCGFRKTGEAKRQIKKRDGYHDVFYMEILRSEWEKNQKGDAVTRKYTDFRGGFEI
jgi:RimJ/RimL family protein N-acetyltransferase